MFNVSVPMTPRSHRLLKRVDTAKRYYDMFLDALRNHSVSGGDVYMSRMGEPSLDSVLSETEQRHKDPGPRHGNATAPCPPTPPCPPCDQQHGSTFHRSHHAECSVRLGFSRVIDSLREADTAADHACQSAALAAHRATNGSSLSRTPPSLVENAMLRCELANGRKRYNALLDALKERPDAAPCGRDDTTLATPPASSASACAKAKLVEKVRNVQTALSMLQNHKGCPARGAAVCRARALYAQAQALMGSRKGTSEGSRINCATEKRPCIGCAETAAARRDLIRIMRHFSDVVSALNTSGPCRVTALGTAHLAPLQAPVSPSLINVSHTTRSTLFSNRHDKLAEAIRRHHNSMGSKIKDSVKRALTQKHHTQKGNRSKHTRPKPMGNKDAGSKVLHKVLDDSDKKTVPTVVRAADKRTSRESDRNEESDADVTTSDKRLTKRNIARLGVKTAVSATRKQSVEERTDKDRAQSLADTETHIVREKQSNSEKGSHSDESSISAGKTERNKDKVEKTLGNNKNKDKTRRDKETQSATVQRTAMSQRESPSLMTHETRSSTGWIHGLKRTPNGLEGGVPPAVDATDPDAVLQDGHTVSTEAIVDSEQGDYPVIAETSPQIHTPALVHPIYVDSDFAPREPTHVGPMVSAPLDPVDAPETVLEQYGYDERLQDLDSDRETLLALANREQERAVEQDELADEIAGVAGFLGY